MFLPNTRALRQPLEHSPSHFREERQRARTLTASAIIVTALSLIPRGPSLTHGAAAFVETAQKGESATLVGQMEKDLSIKTSNTCLNITKWFK